jgi:membrane-associated phospholipid phosphatase
MNGSSNADKLPAPEDRLAWRIAGVNWRLIAVMGIVLGLGLAAMGLSIEPAGLAVVAAIASLYGASGWYHLYRKPDPDPKMVMMLTSIGQLIFIATFMGPLTYVGGALNFPLQDQLFLAIDRALGIDPKMLLEFFNARPDWNAWLEVGYGMIKWPLLGVPLILGMTGRLLRLQTFVLAFALALIATLVIAAVVPAVGTYYGLGLAVESMPNLSTRIYGLQAHDIPALRDGSLRALELFKLAGIVSFPSFHAASALLYAWALWPVRGFGLFVSALCVLMLVATPVVGAHYFIDVVGGFAVAVAAIAVSRLAAVRLGRVVMGSAQSTALASAWIPRRTSKTFISKI